MKSELSLHTTYQERQMARWREILVGIDFPQLLAAQETYLKSEIAYADRWDLRSSVCIQTWFVFPVVLSQWENTGRPPRITISRCLL